MKTLTQEELDGVMAGDGVTEKTSAAYDFFNIVGNVFGVAFGFFANPIPSNWHSGTIGVGALEK